MTIGGPSFKAVIPESPTIKAVYHIDEGWVAAAGRSLQAMIDSRVAEMTGAEEKPAKRRKKTRGATMSDLGKIEGFVSADLPILEAVFRLLLINENKPMEIGQISQELAEHGIGIRDARSVRPETLVRILDADQSYGVRRMPEA